MVRGQYARFSDADNVRAKARAVPRPNNAAGARYHRVVLNALLQFKPRDVPVVVISRRHLEQHFGTVGHQSNRDGRTFSDRRLFDRRRPSLITQARSGLRLT